MTGYLALEEMSQIQNRQLTMNWLEHRQNVFMKRIAIILKAFPKSC